MDLNASTACEQCQEDCRLPGERFCRKCKASVLSALRHSEKYRAFWAPITVLRSADKRQGYDRDPSPWQENAIRELEECPWQENAIRELEECA